MEISQWSPERLRDVLTAGVLSIVDDKETYGYLIGQRLAEGGLGAVKGATLYPLLTRPKHDGDVVAFWRNGDGGPNRKYYSITPSGQQRLNALRTDWRILLATPHRSF